MEVRQNRNICHKEFHKPLHLNQAACSFRGLPNFGNACSDVFAKVKPNANAKKLGRYLSDKAKSAYHDLKHLFCKKDNTIDFSRFKNTDAGMEFSDKGSNVLQDSLFGHYFFSDTIYKNFLKVLESSKNLSIENHPKIQEASNSAYYDFPIKFAISVLNTFQKGGNVKIVEKIPPVFEGLKLKKGAKELFEKLDMLPSLFQKYSLEKGNEFFFKIGSRKFTVEKIGYGGYGSIYKIQDAARKKPPVAMKVFHDPYEVSSHGVFGEIGFYKELNRAKLKDVPDFYMANPIGDMHFKKGGERGKGGWMITEFINENTPLKNNTDETFQSFMKKCGLMYNDHLDYGNRIGEYYVDLGGIANVFEESNKLVEFGPGKEISLVLEGMRKGETIEDLITAIKNCSGTKNSRT